MSSSRPPIYPYHLRINKAVDRELFIRLLSRLASELQIENYRYIGLGGWLLDDFRLVRTRLEIDDLICVESDKQTHKRQEFNCIEDKITCIQTSLEDYIDILEDFEKRVIIWFDYTDAGANRIKRFVETIFVVPVNSILRVTLNAQPGSWLVSDSDNPLRTNNRWRLERFREIFGIFFPRDLRAIDMSYNNFGKSLLRGLHSFVESQALNLPEDRCIVWALATHYADGQPMVTATLIVCSRENKLSVEKLIGEWKYSCTPTDPTVLDIPHLSIHEQLTIESCLKSNEKMERLEKQMEFLKKFSRLDEDPIKSFKTLHCLVPQYLRVKI